VGLQAATSLVVTEAVAPITVVVSVSDTISRIEVPLLCTASGDGSLGGGMTLRSILGSASTDSTPGLGPV
jgi:hypothetical protein